MTSKVTKYFSDLVNWHKEIRLKGHAGTNRTNLKFKGESKNCPTLWEATLDPLAKVMKWGNLREEIEENKNMIRSTWVNYPWTLTFHGLWDAGCWQTEMCERLYLAVGF